MAIALGLAPVAAFGTSSGGTFALNLKRCIPTRCVALTAPAWC